MSLPSQTTGVFRAALALCVVLSSSASQPSHDSSLSSAVVSPSLPAAIAPAVLLSPFVFAAAVGSTGV